LVELWPSNFDTLSSETPFSRSETANVSRKRCGWQFDKEELVAIQPGAFETRGILHAQPGVAEQQNHRLDPGSVPAEPDEGAGRLQQTLDLRIGIGQRRLVGHLGRFERRRRVPLDPARLHTEPEERTQILQPFRRR
jgi:hypothetical protein